MYDKLQDRGILGVNGVQLKDGTIHGPNNLSGGVDYLDVAGVSDLIQSDPLYSKHMTHTMSVLDEATGQNIEKKMVGDWS